MAAPHDRPILLCYDGSDHAQEAIRRAGALMGDRSAIVLHVTGRRRTNSVAEDGRRLPLDAGFDPVSVVDDSTGAVAEAIIAQAEAGRVAAIVVGSRGLPAGSSPILGSVSSRVAHHARHRVWSCDPDPRCDPSRARCSSVTTGQMPPARPSPQRARCSQVAKRSWRTSCRRSTMAWRSDRRCPGRSAAQLRRRSPQLTGTATIFVPLTFITGFFGMNFGWMTDQIDTEIAFWLLGFIVPLATAALSWRLLVRPFLMGGNGSRRADS